MTKNIKIESTVETKTPRPTSQLCR